MTLFNFQGNALDSIKVLNKPCENLLTNISFEQNGITTSPSGWNVWTSDSSDENTVRTEYGDAYDGDYKLTFWDDKDQHTERCRQFIPVRPCGHLIGGTGKDIRITRKLVIHSRWSTLCNHIYISKIVKISRKRGNYKRNGKFCHHRQCNALKALKF